MYVPKRNGWAGLVLGNSSFKSSVTAYAAMSGSFKVALRLSKMSRCDALLQSSCIKQRYLKHLILEGVFPMTSCTFTGADLFLGTLERRGAWCRTSPEEMYSSVQCFREEVAVIIFFLSLNRISRIAIKSKGTTNITSAFRLLTAALSSPACDPQRHLSTSCQ